jgi:hypothetical protein
MPNPIRTVADLTVGDVVRIPPTHGAEDDLEPDIEAVVAPVEIITIPTACGDCGARIFRVRDLATGVERCRHLAGFRPVIPAERPA